MIYIYRERESLSLTLWYKPSLRVSRAFRKSLLKVQSMYSARVMVNQRKASLQRKHENSGDAGTRTHQRQTIGLGKVCLTHYHILIKLSFPSFTRILKKECGHCSSLPTLFDNSTQNHTKCGKKPIRQIGNVGGPVWGSYLVRLMESEKEKRQEDNNNEEARIEFSKNHIHSVS